LKIIPLLNRVGRATSGKTQCERAKLSISKYGLIAIAGLLWCGVGVILCKLAYGWLLLSPPDMALTLGGGGVGLAFLADKIGFYKIAQKNLERLNGFSEKQCVLTFIPLKSYLMIAIMIPLGITLRHSPIPKHYLAVAYITMGGALFLSGLRYFFCLWRVFVLSDPCQTSQVQSQTEENRR
jgi:hypothetical protein